MIPAAAAYVALTFAAGFGLGALRELVVRPAAGETAALLIEAPIMLAVMVLAARWTLKRLMPKAGLNGRLAMGFAAFALLITLEIAGSVALRGLTPAQWLAQFGTVPGLISLALFAAFPVMPALVGQKASA